MSYFKKYRMNLIYSKIGGCLRNEHSDYVVKVVDDLIEEEVQKETKRLNDLLEELHAETVNIEEKIYQALRKHKLPLKKREELMPDLLTLFSEILNKQK